MGTDQAVKLAEEDAALAVERARTGDGPVTWLTTGPSDPPLRAFGHAEDVWQDDDIELWGIYAEAFESTLEEADVELGWSDQGVYAIDLGRFMPGDELPL